MSVSAVHVVAHGRVQGVGFRFFVREKASLFGLNGWVKNRSDGTVELYVEGEDGDVRDFITDVEKGPVFGNVSEMTVEWTTPENRFTEFNIKF
jgi:acylphosphatase